MNPFRDDEENPMAEREFDEDAEDPSEQTFTVVPDPLEDPEAWGYKD